LIIFAPGCDGLMGRDSPSPAHAFSGTEKAIDIAAFDY
jgi:hypothetical protein